ncbi:MAG TPA: DnaA regulatory inactivator Hda [Woeseiaceae bacterium]|nr:DnaA regulatory inactivator Hda [Woeseiaceae bacterium]|tara:strand:- start:20603 stop:21292 length:690 start_codon:yes stop_codon:yes gene_type:complete
MGQMALPVQLNDYAVFESFLPAKNFELYELLKDLPSLDDSFSGCWIWGTEASGKSHLLQALCERAQDDAIYLPMKDLCKDDPLLLEGLTARRFVCIDDIDICAKENAWEMAFFDLFNRSLDIKSSLIVSSTFSPKNTGFALNDLMSRFSQYPAFKLIALDDEERKLALQLRARHRGIDLSDEILNYLLNNECRDMSSLYNLLEILDIASLTAKRRLTIPFVKEVMSEMN